MALPEQRTRTGISISFAREPGLVRTIRQVAAATARQAGASDSVVEQVRLAVGEACGVMVATTRAPEGSTYDDRIHLSMTTAPRLHVRITCETAPIPRQRDPGRLDAWILLRGLVRGLVVSEDTHVTSVDMPWTL